MTMHFAQVAFAFIASGAAVLIVAGLVLEALHEKHEPLRQFGRPPDPPRGTAIPELSVVPDHAEVESLEEASPFPHPRGDHARRGKRGRGRSEAERQRDEEQGQIEKGNSRKQRSKGSAPPASAETEDA